MLSYQIINYYELINKELIDFHSVLVPIFEWSDSYLKYTTETLVKVLKCNTITSSEGIYYVIKEGKIQKEYDEIVRKMKNVFSSYVIFKAFGEFKQKIDYYKKDNNIFENDYIQEFINETDKLFESYQDFQKDDVNQVKMISFANQLIKYKLLFDNTLKMYSDYSILSTEETNIDESNMLCLQLLEVEYTMEEFATVLKGINDSYLEICSLIYENTENIEYKKLKIIKIESGSLFSKISGEKVVIEILKKILTKAITWVQVGFQQGDKILSHQKFANVLKDDVELMKLLQENGCEVSEAKQNIEKAFYLLAKESLYLAKSTCNIKIDDEEFKMGDTQRQKFLKEVKVKLLDKNKNIDEDEENE